MKRFLSCLRVRVAIALMLGIGSVGGLVTYADVGVPFNGWLQLNGGYAQVPYQDEINLVPANGSFTIEGWIKNPYFIDSSVADTPHGAIYKKDSFSLYFAHITTPFPSPGHSTYSVAFWSCGSISCVSNGGHVLSDCGAGSICPPQGWFHFAYVYNQATGKGAFFWNGGMLSSDEQIPNASTEPIVLHYAVSMDEFRISNNVRYTASFTPPSVPFGCDGNTQALWHFDEITGTTTFHDACGTVDNMFVGYNGAHTEGVPLVPLTAVTISGPITGTTNTTQVFSATVSPITATIPITYTWIPAPDSGQGTASANYSWLTDGNKTITVTAENMGGIVTDTHTISLNTPVTGVVINGPTTGMVNKIYTFTAAVNPPAATMPITYTWSPGPNSGQGTALVTFTWGITGTQMITVTAENAGGVVSDTQSIAIGEQHLLYLPLIRR